jgi:hypothetical protein
MNIAQRLAGSATLLAAGVFLLSGYWCKGCDYGTGADWARFAAIKGVGFVAGILFVGGGLIVLLGSFRRQAKDKEKPAA